MATPEELTTNMLRMICGTLFYSASLQTAREMCGKSYFELGVVEKASVDRTAFAMIAENFQAVTPENLASQASPKPTGFQAPISPTEKKT
jgi:hypothetical protein